MMPIVTPRQGSRKWAPMAIGLLAAVFGAGPPTSGQDRRTEETVSALEPQIEIVPPVPKGQSRLRFDTLVTSSSIRRVDFLLDDRIVGSDRRFPFGVTLTREALQDAGRLEVQAYGTDETELAWDRIYLESDQPTFAVSVSEVRSVGDSGWVEIAAEVDHSTDDSIERVDFYRDQRYVASVGDAPYRTRIPKAETTGYLRAVAHLERGGYAESVHVVGSEANELSVTLVEVYAMVSDRSGSPMSGLAADRFELLHNGRAQPIERFVEGDEVPLSLGIVLDSSGSMNASMARAKESARSFLKSALDDGDRALLIDFDSRPRLLHPLTDEIDSLVSRFDDIQSRGSSAVYDAILFGLLQLEETSGRKALVLLTDGLDSGSYLTASQCSVVARQAGVPVFVISLGQSLGDLPSHQRLELERLAAQTGGATYPIRRAEDIASAYSAIELQ
jgi:Ca-activated chloride channel family protein